MDNLNVFYPTVRLCSHLEAHRRRKTMGGKAAENSWGIVKKTCWILYRHMVCLKKQSSNCLEVNNYSHFSINYKCGSHLRKFWYSGVVMKRGYSEPFNILWLLIAFFLLLIRGVFQKERVQMWVQSVQTLIIPLFSDSQVSYRCG